MLCYAMPCHEKFQRQINPPKRHSQTPSLKKKPNSKPKEPRPKRNKKAHVEMSNHQSQSKPVKSVHLLKKAGYNLSPREKGSHAIKSGVRKNRNFKSSESQLQPHREGAKRSSHDNQTTSRPAKASYNLTRRELSNQAKDEKLNKLVMTSGRQTHGGCTRRLLGQRYGRFPQAATG